MDVTAFLRVLQADRRYRGQIAAVKEIPARPARFAAPGTPIHPVVQAVLRAEGIDELYLHQAQAIDALAAGRHVVIVTGTASGKTLCYNLPVVQKLLEDPQAKALYTFPTKALAQDQLGMLQRLAAADRVLGERIRPATYDGDTPTNHRRKVRESANIILTNPDMLHQGILPYHGRWAGFFARLRCVVIDELHSYRGIFGSHVAGVLRRLRRICEHYDARPQFVCCSATIANPAEHATRLTGLPVETIDEDGSPRGRKLFVLWNPPLLQRDRLARRSANIEAQALMSELIEAGAQTITFCKARVVAELIYRYLRDEFKKRRPDLAERIRPYRGGYLANERREIERLLFSGRLLAVSTTNALELGIDVGTLDAALIVGFPGTICSTWQQAGRAGRTNAESLVVFIAYNDPIDQYLVRHGDYFFGRSHEHAVIDPQNEAILAAQLRCASSELTLDGDNGRVFGPDVLARCRSLAEQDPDGGWWHDRRTDAFRYHAPGGTTPTSKVNLRNISETSYAIVDETGGRAEAIGNVDAISAPELVYPEAVYLHEGESYVVRDLDLAAKVARVERAEVDYYTQPVLADSSRVVERLKSDDYRGGRKHFGIVDVTWQTIAFKKIKYYTMEVVGQTALNLPAQTIRTQAVWVQPPARILEDIRLAGFVPVEGLVGIRNMMLAVLPLVAMCDRQDTSGSVDSAHHTPPAMFVYDRYPGGVGYARKGYEELGDVLAMCRLLVRECPCQDGCPSCVGLANLRPPQHQDPDLTRGYVIPNKHVARRILDAWQGA